MWASKSSSLRARFLTRRIGLVVLLACPDLPGDSTADAGGDSSSEFARNFRVLSSRTTRFFSCVGGVVVSVTLQGGGTRSTMVLLFISLGLFSLVVSSRRVTIMQGNMFPVLDGRRSEQMITLSLLSSEIEEMLKLFEVDE